MIAAKRLFCEAKKVTFSSFHKISTFKKTSKKSNSSDIQSILALKLLEVQMEKRFEGRLSKKLDHEQSFPGLQSYRV